MPPIRCALADATAPKRALTRCVIGTLIPISGSPTSIRSRRPVQFPRQPRSSRHRPANIRSSGALSVLPSPTGKARLNCAPSSLGSYLDCTGCNRILHLQGLPNCEYDPAYPFTVEHPCDSTWNPAGRQLDISATNTMLSPRAIPLRKRLGEYTKSEHDWAWILHAVAPVNGVVEW